MTKKILLGTFAVRLLIAISTFVVFIVSAKLLGAEGRGTLSIFIANVTIVQLVSEIIFGPGYIYLTQHVPFKKLFFSGIAWSLLASIVVPVVLYYTHIQTRELLPYLFINSFLLAVITGINYQLQATRQSIGFNCMNGVQAITSMAFVWLMLQTNLTTEAFCMALLYSYTVTIITGLFFLLKFYFNTNFQPGRSDKTIGFALKNGLIAQYSNLLNFANMRIGFYLIYLILGDIKELGIYAAAASLVEAVWIISNTLATWLYPQIAASMNRQQQIEKTQSFASVAFWYSFAALILLFCIPESFLLLLFGNDFVGITHYIAILLPGTLIAAYGKIYWNYFAGTGQFKINNYSSLISTLVALSGSIPLMYYYRIEGLALSTSLSYMVYAFLLILIFRQQNHLPLKAVLPSFKLFP
ncbi:MAG: polysaccharide biosynthesis C-terminal domain-containing protein [Cytophaga sp.]|uniref:polysaccharide biosynthesis C-terminal domain-containing protein n=1 Tax=Cytophaga sp. TaxID=29535 RepID=UPI003F816EBA